MEYDKDKVDEAALGILYLTLGADGRAWKGLDWDITDRLYEKGLIFDPKNKAKSIEFTEEGIQRAKEAFHNLFVIEDN